RKFAWGSTISAKKVALVKWETGCKPSETGGLGIMRMMSSNLLFLIKLAYQLVTKLNPLWVRKVLGYIVLYHLPKKGLGDDRCLWEPSTFGTIKKRQYMCYVIICLPGMYGERWFLEDGSANSNGSTVGVVRDSHENWVILHGLEVVRSKSYSKVVIESDCLHTLEMIKDKLENISFDTHSNDTI
ncbi:hypothetical protein Goari_025882, partial [Gossypium aridum]|nr:hypothetical protein [Gossypium aridum]